MREAAGIPHSRRRLRDAHGGCELRLPGRVLCGSVDGIWVRHPLWHGLGGLALYWLGATVHFARVACGVSYSLEDGYLHLFSKPWFAVLGHSESSRGMGAQDPREDSDREWRIHLPPLTLSVLAMSGLSLSPM